MTARLVIAAPHSGSGKTTLAAGLIGAYRKQGFTVQPYKCGLDYIDPGYHTLSAGRPCRNLDTWLLPPEQIHTVFMAAIHNADLALVEGVMGLFDGAGGENDSGSTAEVARLLEAPIILVIDARGMGRSVAALVDGFQRFDPRLRIGGVLLNRVGSERHANLCKAAITDHTGLPCFGYLQRQDAFRLPERHLGLVTTAEDGPWSEVLDHVVATLAETCDLSAVLRLARTAPPLVAAPSRPSSNMKFDACPVIAIARDAAFSFAYRELDELLLAAGAHVVPFSPLSDVTLPAGTCGIILTGSFPELHAESLSRNHTMHNALRAAYKKNIPIYAECGGLMYLTEELVDQQGQPWPMVGLLNGQCVMTDRVTLGYRTIETLIDNPLLPTGTVIRGHEFHYSRWEHDPHLVHPAYMVLPKNSSERREGVQSRNLVASYIHLHWLARSDIASRFVGHCAAAANNKEEV